MDVITAIKQRKSVRKYLDKPVSDQIVHEILDIARWAPSGANCQPWRVEVVTGATKDRITQAIIQAKQKGLFEEPELEYYPQTWINPYKKRRFECGLALYSAMGIKRGDNKARKEAWYKNYDFFGAPVGLFFFMPKELGIGFLMDMGMFIQTVALTAMTFGLSTCIQASLAEFPRLIRQELNVPDNFRLVCGMSLGYEDESANVNQFRTTRVKVDEFTNWHH